MNRVLAVLTHLGDGEIWISLYLISFLFLKEALAATLLPIVTAEAVGLALIISLRYTVKRERPDKTYKAHLLAPWNRYSFPSHHAMRSFIIAVAAGARCSNLILPLSLLALAICFSRVCLRKHYLSDVVVGAVMGGILAAASMNFLCLEPT